MMRMLFLAVVGLSSAAVLLWWREFSSSGEGVAPLSRTAGAATSSGTDREAGASRIVPARASSFDRTNAAGNVLQADPVVVADCTVAPLHEQVVASQLDGEISRILVAEGSRVRSGDELGRLNSSRIEQVVRLHRLAADSEVAVQSAGERHQEAQAQLEAVLARRDSASREEKRQAEVRLRLALLEIDQAREQRQKAQLELGQALHEWKLHTLRSGVNGVVVKVHKKEGETVGRNEPLFRVVHDDQLGIEGLCTPAQAERLRPGMPALVAPERRSEPVKTLRGHTGAITALAVSPDGRWLVSASTDRTVRLWDWPAGGERAVLPHPAEVHAVALSVSPPYEGRAREGVSSLRLATGAADGKVRLWTLTDQGRIEAEVVELTHSLQSAVRSVALSADGRWCASGGEDRQIQIWDTRRGTRLYSVRSDTAHLGSITSLQFAPDHHLVSAGRDNVLRVWKLAKTAAELAGEFEGRTGDIAQFGLGADGQRLLFDHGPELRFLDRGTGRTLGILRNHRQESFQSLAVFSPDSRLVLTSSGGGRLQLWRTPPDAPESGVLHAVSRHGFRRHSLLALSALADRLVPSPVAWPTGWLLSVAPSEGATRESASPDPTARREPSRALLPALWPLSAHEVLHLVAPEGSATTRCGVFAPDGRLVFTGGDDRVLRAWVVPARTEARQLLEARLTFVAGQVESGTGLIRIRAEVENPPAGSPYRLRPGATAHLILYPEE
jgi:WD40 repeat protein